ncbi:MAG: hypothetical protein A2687_00285 [Candidatus Levybacteria bacterium RIFCSPHIGHO2_01_FULL_38_26]|nr:MAG: hypothetical protein A2687_00285 [Candidatus Levybacteria bacterium RIFCSPHIGHO2_01_FULL_38_26]
MKRIHIKISSLFRPRIAIVFTVVSSLISLGIFTNFYIQNKTLESKIASLSAEETKTKNLISTTEKELNKLKNEDQYVINQDQKERIKNIETTYKKAVASYEKLLDLKSASKNTSALDELFAESLNFLSEQNYASGDAKLTQLNQQIDEENAKTAAAAAAAVPTNVPQSNTPPSSGYNRQTVSTDIGNFLVSIVSADLNSTRVIVDTASESDCSDNCPVLPLGDYVSRNGAFAGVNGSYFCPSDYPSCAGKVNTFDTLLMNKNKVYFNSENNKFSTVPLIYFSGNSAGIRGQTLEWGRDTGVDMVIANQGLLLLGGNIMFGGDGDPKKGSKGGRSFVGNKGNTAYIGVVHNATVAESAYALKALGLENALNLDDGGSTALWSGGYRVGPGRNLPNVVLFIRK